MAFDRVLVALERVTSGAAAVSLFVVMLVAVVDVVMRYFFNAPLPWSYDLVSIYLMSALFFFALPGSYRAGFHVNVDILFQHFPPALKDTLRGVVAILAAAVFVPMVWMAARRSWESWATGEVISGPIPWPTWITPAMLVVGVAVLTLQLAAEALGAFGRVLRGTSAPDHAPGTRHGSEPDHGRG